MAERRRVQHYRKLKKKDFALSLCYILPLMTVVVAVTFVPIIVAVRWSLHDTYYLQIRDFVGLNNYKRIFTEGFALQAIGNSLWYVFGSLVVVFLLGIPIAVVLNSKFRFRDVFRTMIIIPWVISQTITAMLFRWIYNNSFGVLVFLIERVSGARINFLGEVWAARISTLIANCWNSMPIVIIMMLAALQSIPQDIYDSAKVDGASSLQMYARITLPLLKPTIVITLVMQSIEYFSMVTLIKNLTDGGPLYGTLTLSVYGYRSLFTSWDAGGSAAISVLILLFNAVLSLFYIRLLSKNQDDEA